jgi:excisionase family DNA binding protein
LTRIPGRSARGLSLVEAGCSGNEDRLLDAGEVAAMLAVPERWVRKHTRSGLFPHVRLGRYVRYRREAVLAWLDEQEQLRIWEEPSIRPKRVTPESRKPAEAGPRMRYPPTPPRRHTSRCPHGNALVGRPTCR